MLPFVAGSANPQRHVPQELGPALQAVSLPHTCWRAGDAQGVPRSLTGHLDVALGVMENAAS